mmetsp:Transcript_59052/g.129468  ORF Transcript_59052/g.129468 Transcript_59052/m.129468 type:complete len:278 (-) Transcript_59052:40-873(-)
MGKFRVLARRLAQLLVRCIQVKAQSLNFVVDAGEALLQILPVDLLIVLHLLSMLLQFFLQEAKVLSTVLFALTVTHFPPILLRLQLLDLILNVLQICKLLVSAYPIFWESLVFPEGLFHLCPKTSHGRLKAGLGNRLLGDVIQLSTELGHSFSQVLTAVAPMQRFHFRCNCLHLNSGGGGVSQSTQLSSKEDLQLSASKLQLLFHVLVHAALQCRKQICILAETVQDLLFQTPQPRRIRLSAKGASIDRRCQFTTSGLETLHGGRIRLLGAHPCHGT